MNGNTRKLTLEERLSLAAKKGKKKPKKIGSSPASQSPPPDNVSGSKLETSETIKGVNSAENAILSILTDSEDKTQLVTTQSSTERPGSKEEPLVYENVDRRVCSSPREEPWSQWLSGDQMSLNAEELLKTLRPHVEELVNENERLREQAASSKSANTESSLVKLIKEKDGIIDRLRQEGDQLSKTELRQSNIIKNSRKRIVELENNLGTLEDDLSKKIELYEKLYSSHTDSLNELKGSEAAVIELIKDREKLYSVESILIEKDARIKSLEKALETKEKDLSEAVTSHQKESELLKRTTEEQVMILEASLEQLRIESEKSSENELSANFNSTSNLQERYNRLFEDFKSSKANSQAIEDALNSKVSGLESQIEDMTLTYDRYSLQIDDNIKKNSELELKLHKSEQMHQDDMNKINELQSTIVSLEASIRNLNDDYSHLQHKYDIQKDQLEHNIDQQKTKNGLQIILPESHQTKDFESDAAKLDDNWIITQNSSLEVMETPKILKEPFLTKDDNSLLSQVEKYDKYDMSMELDDMPDEASDLGSLNRETSFRNSSSRNLNRYSSELGSSARMNAQVVSKLGAEIRKFEVELSSLQNLCDKTQKERNEANDEIIRLLEENEKVNHLITENLNLSRQVEELGAKLDASLQLLGEKTELAEELENDVADLKDMMRQQIQDMIKLQEKR